MSEIIVVKFNNKEVVLDPSNLKFNENNINEYLESLGGLISYYGQQYADADYHFSVIQKRVDNITAAKYAFFKEEGRGTDKLCEALASTDPEVLALEEELLKAKYARLQLQQYLRSLDITHQNLISRGHMLRKEMDKLGVDGIYKSSSDIIA